jgi:hypothetical protein
VVLAAVAAVFLQLKQEHPEALELLGKVITVVQALLQ